MLKKWPYFKCNYNFIIPQSIVFSLLFFSPFLSLSVERPLLHILGPLNLAPGELILIRANVYLGLSICRHQEFGLC